MNLLKNRYKNKSIAQGLVEFALVIPVLMVVIVGMMEIGRLMLIFISVTTSSRTSARYGSAVGEDGGVPQYKDCTGILNAGLIMSPLSGITVDDITIEYDNGIEYDINDEEIPRNIYASCDTLSGNIAFGDRILVTVVSEYVPMNIIPILQLQGFPIRSTSRRLIQITNPEAFYTATGYNPPPPNLPSPTNTFTPPPYPTHTSTFTPSLTHDPAFTKTDTPPPGIPLTDTLTPSETPLGATPFPPTATIAPPPSATPTQIPDSPIYDEDGGDDVITTPSGQNCTNTILNWSPAITAPTAEPPTFSWAVEPGFNPATYLVQKDDLSPWIVVFPGGTINVGNINHNKTTHVRITAVFPGPFVSNTLVYNIKCKFGALQSIANWIESP